MKSPMIFQKIKEKIGGKVSAKLSKLSYRQFFFLIFLVCVVVFASLLIFLPDDSSTQTAKQKQQQAKPKVETVKVVTANRDIPPRTILREDMLVVRDMPNNILPDGYVTDVKQAINLPAAVALQKGDVLTTKKFYADIRMAGFPGKIPEDCRAVSIGISDITGVAGFAKPGDYVDIMAVDGKRGSKNMTGKLLLQNILLLGINKSAKVEQPVTTAPASSKDNKKQGQEEGKTEEASSDSKDKDKKKEAAEPGSTASAQAMATATLAVTPAEALKLAVASQTGTLYLALRPVIPKEAVVLDTEYVADVGIDDSEHSDRSGGNGSNGYDEEDEGLGPYHRTYQERVAAYRPDVASVPLPPTGDTADSTKTSTSTPAQDEDTVEIIRGTQSTKVRGGN